MLQLLQPIWLYALTGLLVPVAIHLWNQRPGKTLLVGSIALISANTLAKTKKIRISEWWLLLLRCLLLAAVAFALAGPLWQRKAMPSEKGWVLLPTATAAAAYQHFKGRIDSLLAAGYELHYFDDGFAKTSVEEITKRNNDSAAAATLSYRAITDLLQQTVDANRPLFVFTDNYLHHFSGTRNPAALNLHWQTYTPADTMHPSATVAGPLRVAIFSQTKEDGQYIRAALEAIRSYSKKEILISVLANPKELPAQQDWLFWLSPDSLPADINAANVLKYAAGTPVPERSFVLPAANGSFAPLPLYQRVPRATSAAKENQVYWKDAFGEPLLAARVSNTSVYYTLYTHIDPAWNALPWTGSFPQLMYQLLYSATLPADALLNSHAIIDSTQVLPLPADAMARRGKLQASILLPLGGLAWLLSFLLLLAERCLSFFYRKQVNNGSQ